MLKFSHAACAAIRLKLSRSWISNKQRQYFLGEIITLEVGFAAPLSVKRFHIDRFICRKGGGRRRGSATRNGQLNAHETSRRTSSSPARSPEKESFPNGSPPSSSRPNSV